MREGGSVVLAYLAWHRGYDVDSESLSLCVVAVLWLHVWLLCPYCILLPCCQCVMTWVGELLLLLCVVAVSLCVHGCCVVAVSLCVSDEGMGGRAKALLFGSHVTISDVAPGWILR